MRDFKRTSLSLIKKGGIGALSALLLPVIVFAVTTIGSNVTTDGHVLPGSNNASDLGAFGTAVRDIYASGTFRNQVLFNAGNLNASGTTYLSYTVPANNNAWDLGSATSSWRDIYASGTHYGGGFNASSTSVFNNIRPAAVNLYDLGASSTPWRSISASTSIVLGRQAASTTLGIASNSVAGTKGQGTCIALRAADGTLVYLSVTSTPIAASPWQSLAVSTVSCE